MHFSDDRAVFPRHDPDKKYMVEAFIPDARTRRGSVDGLRTAGPNSEVRLYKAVSDGNGGYKYDNHGHALLGKIIKRRII